MKGLLKNEKVVKLGKFINRHMGIIMCMLMVAVMVASVASAGGAGGGSGSAGGQADVEDLWTKLTDLIQKWVTRLGGVVMFVGGVTFGLGWKSDDAEQKSRGISTIVAGAIVAAVAAMAGQFF